MVVRHYVGAYWGPRRESAVDCAEHLASCLTELAKIAPALGDWRKKGMSQRTAQDPISIDVATLNELLLAGRNRTDFGGEPIVELGFRVEGWNGQDNAASFSTGCGSYSEVPGIGNNFLLKLPEPSGDTLELYEPIVAEKIVKVILDSWAPEWLTWTSRVMRKWLPRDPDRPVVGWLTYLDRTYAYRVAADRLPDGVHAQEMGTGTIVKIGDGPLDVRGDQVRATAAAIEPAKKAS